MTYRNLVGIKVGGFIVGQYVIFPTTGNGSWSGTFMGFGEPLGQYAPDGAVDVMVRLEGSGEVRTLRTSRLYSGYMTPLDSVQPEPEPEPQRRLFEVQVPVCGEVIFTVEAYSEEEAREVASRESWGDGELNIEHDDDAETHVECLGEA